jgi:hypothetical protein
MTDTSYQDRVRVERAELGERMRKLSHFIAKSDVYRTLPPEERALLFEQHLVMDRLLAVLDKRIALFKP